jgi:ectoine hydroxylase-related dioxygenase (phytanoyl-CoA dioxygenase family)
VAEVQKRLETVYVVMEPGDTLFFHCNLLHRSDQNRSDNPRWSMICCYNAARNNPYKESHHPRYTPLQKVPDSAIKAAGLRRFSDPHTDVAWMDPDKDVSARSLEKS